METAMAELKKVKASMMNAIHDLPLLVARDEGFFRDEGLDVDILVTPGSGQHNSDDRALKDDIFKRGLEATYDQGQCDQFRMCEWGIMKRAVETDPGQEPAPGQDRGAGLGDVELRHRGRSEVRHLRARAAQERADRGQPVQRLALHHAEDDGRLHQARRDQDRQRRHPPPADGGGDVRQGQGREPAGAVDQRRRGQGRRVLIESHSTRSEAAGDEMDGPTLAKMFRAEARAAEAIQKNPEKYAHYIVEEAGGLIGLKDLKLARILNAPPTPYTRERFDDNYNWTLGWGLVPPGATYENTVDNRAWQ